MSQPDCVRLAGWIGAQGCRRPAPPLLDGLVVNRETQYALSYRQAEALCAIWWYSLRNCAESPQSRLRQYGDEVTTQATVLATICLTASEASPTYGRAGGLG